MVEKSTMADSKGNVRDEIQFRWGTKGGVSPKHTQMQFYRSFEFDHVRYSLYDSVYLFKHDDPQPHIGKIVKIWELPVSRRRVKILWFFHPTEIQKYLGDHRATEKELFLACGDGAGLADVNPLEALAGKCCVVCTSRDERNPQPSNEHLAKANYFFSRVFDVGTCMVAEKLPDKIAGVEVSELLNKKNHVVEDKKSLPRSVVKLCNEELLKLPPKEIEVTRKVIKEKHESCEKSMPTTELKDFGWSSKNVMEATTNPNAGRKKWFKSVSWDEKLKQADEQGTLVYLQNLDPSLTETDIENVIYGALNLSCHAKVINHPSYGNVCYGQAYLIFRSRDLADQAVLKISTGCLLLSGGRPLFCSKGMLKIPKQSSTLPGHLWSSKVKIQMREELKKSVAASHCSQPNTIEYDMAVEWLLSREKSDVSLKALQERHAKERMQLAKNLKTFL